MSRTRLEKNPERECGFNWADADPWCAHRCTRPVGEHGDHHICCAAPGGKIHVDAS